LNRSCPFGDTIYLIISVGVLLVSYIFIISKFCCQAIFPYSENFKNFSADKNPARLQAGGAEIPNNNKENSIFSNESEFVSNTTSAQNKSIQTFSIILPNLIHKSRKKNLKR